MRRFSTLLAMAILWVSGLAAQNITGTIPETVTDASGDVLLNVVVTARNLGTNQSRQTPTNESGNYVLPLLPGRSEPESNCRWNNASIC